MKKTMRIALLLCIALLIGMLVLIGCDNTNNPQTPSEPQGTDTVDGGTPSDASTPNTEAHVHTFGEWNIAKHATCAENGSKERDCSCGEKETQSIDKLAHTEVVDEAILPTCTATGLTEGKHCSACNSILVKQEIVNANGHTHAPAAVENRVESNCTTAGSYDSVIYCSVCSTEIRRETNAIVKLGHDCGEWTETLAPTESTKGEKRRDCTRCDYYETDIVAELSHNHGRWAVTILSAVAPTCTETGLTEGEKCSGCGETLLAQNIIPELGHSYGEWTETLAPNCTEKGSERRDCDACDHYETREVNATGHTDVIDQAVAPSCTTTGLTEGKHCFVCGETLVEQQIVPITHDWATTYEYDKGVHWKKCNKCDVTTAGVAHDLGTDGYCNTCNNPIAGSDGVFYFLSSDGTYAEVIDYVGSSTRVVIADEYEGVPVTKISSNAFEGKAINSIVISNSVTSIDAEAFKGCSNLTSFTLPDSIKSIGNSAFSGCTRLTSLTIPNNVTSIGNSILYNCSGLTSITIPYAGKTSYGFLGELFGASSSTYNYSYVPSSLKTVVITKASSIPSDAFRGCTGLTNVTLPNNLTSIGSNAFQSCTSLSTIEFPESVTSIESYAFNGCTSLNAISLPSGLTSLGSYVFSGCTRLSEITIPNGVTTISEGMFSGCSGLTTITIPNGVTSIGKSAFTNCSGLTTITLPESVTSVDEYAFMGCTKIIETINGISYAGPVVIGFDNSVALASIREGTTIIASSAFAEATKLRVVTIPDGVMGIGFGAFRGCTSLTSITLPFVGATKNGENNTHFGYIFGAYSYSSNSNYVPSSLKTIVITGDTSVGSNAFYGTAYYNNQANWENGVLYIGNHLIKVESTISGSYIIKDGTKAIAGGAFYNCTGLTSITIPDSVTSIGDTAFHNCTGLTSVYINDLKAWCEIPFEYSFSNPLSYARNLYLNGTLITELVIPDGVTSIGDYAFSGCTGLTSITIPDSVTSIGDDAFSGCTGLTSITIPGSVTSIGNGAFLCCAGLTGVKIRNGVTSIGSSAFYGCTGLKSLTIPDSVTSIGSSAFSECRGLTSVTIGNSVTSIDEQTFAYCEGLTSITIPDSVTSIGSSAFSGCSGLTSITIGNSVTSIGYSAFSDCRGLTSITIPNSVTSIGYSAFSGCSGLVYNEYDNAYYLGSSTNQYLALIVAKDKYISSCEINTNTKVIADSAFAYCTGLTSITIPNSVTSIGYSAFSGCSGLTSITIGNSVTSIGYSAFSGCSNLTSIEIPAGVTSIGSFAFSGCSGLTSIEIPAGVTWIGNGAFRGCSGLTSIEIPAGVTSIGDEAFEGCRRLTSINFGGTRGQWDAISKGYFWNSSTGNYTIYCTDGNISK